MKNYTVITKENAQEVLSACQRSKYIMGMPKHNRFIYSAPKSEIMKYRKIYLNLMDDIAIAQSLLS